MTFEGEPTKRFSVWWFVKDQQHEREADYDTIAEVKKHRRRPDRVQKVRVGRKFLTWGEFDGWAKDQEPRRRRRRVTPHDWFLSQKRERHKRCNTTWT